MINISSDIVSSISTNVAGAIQSLWAVLAILIALTLSFYIARKIIFLFFIAKR